MSRPCDELGLCQSRAHACAGCKRPFAPGAIQAYRRRPSALVRWAKAFAILIAVSGLLGFAVGYLWGAIQ